MLLNAFYAALATCAICIMFNVRGRDILYGGLSAGLGYFVYLWFAPHNSFAAIFLASAVMTLISELLARKRKKPATLFLVAGLIPLVPGSVIYRCMLSAFEGDTVQATALLYQFLIQTASIAVGIIAISSLLKLLPTVWKPRK